MSLLTAVTNVAEEAGYSVDTAIIGSSDVTTLQLKAIANRIVKEMADAYDWSKMFVSGSITLAAGTASYALPAAFSHYHFDTFWNQSTRWRVLGPMSEQEYAETQGYGLNTAVYQRFQIRGVTSTQLLIYPTPGSGEDGQTIIFEYAADRAVRPQTWVVGLTITAGDYIYYNGIYYTASTSGTTAGTSPTADSGVTWVVYTGSYNTFIADTDEPILDQRTLEQGMLERFGVLKGLTIEAKFLDQLNEDYSRDIPGKTLYSGGEPGRTIFARSNRVVFGGGGF